MRSTYRELVGFLPGGAHPRDVAGAIVLGLLAGSLFGMHYTLMALLLAALVWNVNGRTFVACLLLGIAGGQVFEAEGYQLGRALLEGPLGRAALAKLGDGPWAALFGVNDYALVGTGLLMAAVALPLGLLGAWMIRRERVGLMQSVDGQPVRRRWIANLTARLLIGGNRQHRLDQLSAQRRRFRPWGTLAAAVVAPFAILIPWGVTLDSACDTLLAELSAANQAQVDAGAVSLSLWSGELTIDDLRCADPQNEGRDRLRIRRVTGRISPAALLCGQIHAQQLKIAGARTDVMRHRTMYRPADNPIAEEDRPQVDADDQQASPLELHPHLRDWESVGEQLGRCAQFVAFIRELGNRPSSPDAKRHRCPSRGGLPTMWAQQVELVDLPRALNLGPHATLEITNFTNDPMSTGRPTEMRVVIPEYSAEITVTLNLHEFGQPHDIVAVAHRLPLKDLVAVDRYGPEVDVHGGSVDLVAQGWADLEQLQLDVQIDASQLQVSADGPRPIAGISPTLWNAALVRLDHWQTPTQLVGPWQRPQLLVDPSALVRSLRQQLRAAGASQLVEAIDAGHGNPEDSDIAQRPPHEETTPVETADASAEPLQDRADVTQRPGIAPGQPAAYPVTATPAAWSPPAASVAEQVVDPISQQSPVADSPQSAETPQKTRASGEARFIGIEPTPAPTEVPQPPPLAQRVPVPVDLALGYDSEPFVVFDGGIATREASPDYEVDFETPPTETPTVSAGPAGWTRRARLAIAQLWPFSRPSVPDEDEFAGAYADEYYDEYDHRTVDAPSQLEPWETAAPPEVSAAAKPWYQRIWR